MMTREEFDRRYRARLVERGYCTEDQAAKYPTYDCEESDPDFQFPEYCADEEIVAAHTMLG